MKAILISNKYKTTGWIIFVIFALLGLATMYLDFKISWLHTPWHNKSFGDNNLTNEIALAGVIIGLMLICFSREKIEDELINQIRLQSLQWAVLLNYAILFIVNFVVYDADFLVVMTYTMVSIPVFFIVRFYYCLYRLKTADYEK